MDIKIDIKRVCIVCSISQKPICDHVRDYFEFLDFEVDTPFDDREGSLYERQNRYYKKIDRANLLVVIPKEACLLQDCDGNGTDVQFKVGESVSYEIAIARRLHIPVIIWGETMFPDFEIKQIVGGC